MLLLRSRSSFNEGTGQRREEEHGWRLWGKCEVACGTVSLSLRSSGLRNAAFRVVALIGVAFAVVLGVLLLDQYRSALESQNVVNSLAWKS
jgi:hypothetical protein